MKNPANGLVYRTSRIHYFTNYFIVALVSIILIIIFPSLDIFSNLLDLIIFFALLAIASGFAEEPEWGRLFRKYVVTNNEIKKIEGLLDKKEIIIPYQSVADVTIKKSFLGRILDVGSVHVRGYKEGGDIEMKGMRHPEEIQRIVQNKINLLRETTLKAWKKK